jgi:uncharacterized protein (TIGR03546 family)
MFLFRRIGTLLRGKATPLQIYFACIIGALIAFAPGFAQAPALIIALVMLLLVLNANVTAALLTALPAALVALLVMPVSVVIGRWLLDGPTQPLFQALVNAPVLALFGFEYYATSGGLLLGLAFGTLAGFILVRAVTGFRARMAQLEEGSVAFQRVASAWWSQVLAWIFVGGSHGRLSYRELLERSHGGSPIRLAGVAVVLVLVVLGIVALRLAIEPLVTWAVQRGLEHANGATVDVESAELDLAAGRFRAVGVAMADPNDLHRDLMRIGEMEGAVGMADLLRRRLRIDRIVLMDASSGGERARPGQLVGPPPIPTLPHPDDWEWGDKSLEEILHEAELWKQRLAQAREWLERLDRLRPDPDERRETLSERLEREIRRVGYRRVAAAHLIERTPWVVITEVLADGIEALQLDGEILAVHAEHLSTQPWLIDDAPRIHVRSATGHIDLEIELPALARGGAGENMIRFNYAGLSADRIGRQLDIGDAPPLAGGTIDVAFVGRWSAGIVDFPLQVTVRDSTVTIPNVGSTDVSVLVLPIRVRGPLDNPRVTLRDEDLADALVDAGREELAGRVREEAVQVRERVEERIEQEAGRVLERVIPRGGERER